MLQNIRENAQGTIAKTIIVLLILSLSVWGLDSIVGGSGEASVATVNGEEITEREFERSVRIARQQRLQEMDTPDSSRIDTDQLNEEVLDRLIREKLIEQDIRERGLELTAQDIDRMITQAEQFRVDGAFSQERFTRAVRNQGMTVEGFREMIERDHLTRVLQAVIQGSAFSTETESKRIARLLTQTRDFDVLEVPLSAVMDDVTVSESEIESFYADNKAMFSQEESVDVAWITLDQAQLVDPDSIDEETVRARYRERIDEMGQTEKRNPAHILIADDADRVETVSNALDEGADFGELARQYSDDTASAEDGGELGLSGRNAFAEPFSEALFSIEEKGGIAGPVETSFGTHFIKLLDTEKQDPPSFSDMESELRQEIAQEQAGNRFVELSEELADIAYSEYDLKAPSELIDAEIQTRDGVTRDGNRAPFDHPQLKEQLFSEDVREGGFNTELVEVSQDRAVVARVREYHPEKQKELDTVREQIRELVTERKAREMIEQRLSEGADSESIAGTFGVEWETYQDVGRQGDLGAPAIIRDAAFGMPRPPEDGFSTEVVELPDGMALIRLTGITGSEDNTAAMMAENIQSQLGQRHGQSAYYYYLEQLRSEAEISRD
ncbi:peptidyl-prolyl cis-trans isomerase D [Halospina denitrificans]|uniref:Periplasmic chaperone PpiD n=1 Tax=Halospina denitrificans TaxID=332522 RepID=A0A4R7JNG7_9GAMM|nr:SurA N-terminal domain-containing protein [Halospina denitrificans]TDT39385.1 peptidyl-prolyl cis-trans isomerase D [Halospina denitrificans]